MPSKQNVLQLAKVSTAANRSDLQSFCWQTILSPPFLQFQGLVYGKIEVLFLGIEGFEAVRRFSVATGTAERVPPSHLEDQNISAREERAPY